MRMTMVETDDDLSPKGRAKLRADIANEVLAELDQFQPLSKAKNVVARRISNLKEKMVALPGEPTTQKDLAVAGEIRALLRAKGEDAEQFAFSHRTDPKLVAAILGAPAFLSGMSQDAVERLRAVASQALYPAEVEEIAALEAAERVAMQAAEHARERIARRDRAVIGAATQGHAGGGVTEWGRRDCLRPVAAVQDVARALVP